MIQKSVIKELVKNKLVLKRPGTPEDIAKAAL